MNQIIRSFDAHHVDLHPVPAAIHPRWNQQRQSHVTRKVILKARKVVKKTRRVLTPFIQVGVTLHSTNFSYSFHAKQWQTQTLRAQQDVISAHSTPHLEPCGICLTVSLAARS